MPKVNYLLCLEPVYVLLCSFSQTSTLTHVRFPLTLTLPTTTYRHAPGMSSSLRFHQVSDTLVPHVKLTSSSISSHEDGDITTDNDGGNSDVYTSNDSNDDAEGVDKSNNNDNSTNNDNKYTNKKDHMHVDTVRRLWQRCVSKGAYSEALKALHVLCRVDRINLQDMRLLSSILLSSTLSASGTGNQMIDEYFLSSYAQLLLPRFGKGVSIRRDEKSITERRTAYGIIADLFIRNRNPAGLMKVFSDPRIAGDIAYSKSAELRAASVGAIVLEVS